MALTEHEIFGWSVIIRLVERGLLTCTILAVTIVIMVAFWKRLQRVQFEINHNDNMIKTDIIFVMPVFLLLALILFAFVSFSSPIKSTHTSDKINAKDNAQTKEVPSSKTTFNGVVGGDINVQKYYLNKLSTAVDILEADPTAENKITVGGLINLQRALVKDIYGQPIIDGCLDPNSLDYDSQTCRNIIKWLYLTP